MGLDKTIKNVIWGGIISNNNFKLSYNVVILKDRKKNRKLVFFIMARHLLKDKIGLLLLLIVRSKVYTNY